MALSVFVQFTAKGQEAVGSALDGIKARLNALPAAAHKVGMEVRKAGENFQAAFTIPLALLGALAGRLASLAPKTEAYTQATGRMKAVSIELGKSFQTLLVPILNVLSGILKTIQPFIDGIARAFQSLSPQVQSAVVILGLFLATLGPMLKIVGALVKVFGTLAVVFTATGLKVTAIAVGITALTATVILAARQIGALGDTVGAVFVGIYAKVMEWVQRIKLGVINTIIGTLQFLGIEGLAGFDLQDLVPEADRLRASIATLATQSDDAFTRAGASISTAFEGAKQDILSLGEAITNAINIPLQKAGSVAAATGAKISKIGINVIQSLNTAKKAFPSFFDALAEGFGRWDNTVSSIKDSLSSFFVDVTKGTKTFGDALNQLWKDILDAILKKIADFVASSVVDEFLNIAGSLFGGSKKSGGSDSWIGAAISAIGSILGGIFQSGGERVVSRPTLFMAGEAGPEKVKFSPLGGGSYGGVGGDVVVHVPSGSVIDGMTVGRVARRIAREVWRQQGRQVA